MYYIFLPLNTAHWTFNSKPCFRCAAHLIKVALTIDVNVIQDCQLCLLYFHS